MKRIQVTYFQRRPDKGHWSIEYIFENLREQLNGKIDIKVKIARFVSKGLFKRIYNAIEAAFHQSDVNHITGDIHYVDFFLKKQKTILTIHDCGILKDASKIKRLIFRVFWYDLPTKRARFVTTVSEFTKQELLGYVPSLHFDKVVVIPSAVSDGFVFDKKTFNSKKPALLHIGTAHNKNLPRLAEALDRISCTLTIVGVLDQEQLECLARYKIDYRAVANITEAQMIGLYQESDMLVFVSTLEGFGMPIIEANRTGRPIVTSNLASMPDVAGDSACLVDPYDVGAIRKGILKVITDERYRAGLIAAGIVNAERFDNRVIAQQYLDLYNIIMNGK